MKKTLMLFAFMALISASSFAKSHKLSVTEVSKISLKAIAQNPAVSRLVNEPVYVWGYDGDCLQLYRVELTTSIDYTGMAHEVIQVTEMNDFNCTGMTYRVCPPPGNSYC